MKFTSFLYALVALSVPATAQNTTNDSVSNNSSAVLNSATFMYSTERGANFITTLTAAEDTSNLFFRVSAPTAYDWVAVGIGARMKGAMMLVMYPAADGKSMTLSPRRATGNNEPAYNKNIDCSIVNNADPNKGDQVVVGIMCHNASSWSNPALDITSTNAPFMWAIGPATYNNGSSWSNDPKKDLRIHSGYAQFTMNMTVATVSSNPEMLMPELGNLTHGASANATIKMTRNMKTPAHGILIIIAIIVLIPLDSVIRLCLKSTKIHMVMMGVVSILFLAGSIMGFIVSGMFNRSKSYSSAHQIIGLLVFVLFISQIPLGIVTSGRLTARASADKLARAQDPHYSAPRKTHQPLYLSHLAISGLILLFTVITGGLGFKLSLGSSYSVKYILLVTGVFTVWLGVIGVRWMWNRNRKDDSEDEGHERKTREAIEFYQMQAFQAQQQQQQQTQQGAVPVNQGEGQFPSVAIPRTYG